MRTALAILLLGLTVSTAHAQTIWSRPYTPNQIVVETIVPDVPEEASWLSGATFFTGTASLTEHLEMAAELPVARYGTSEGTTSTTALGNPYLGIGVSSTTLPVLLEVGTRIPTASASRATQIGTTADAGRLQAFRPDELSLSGLLNGRVALSRRTSLRLRTGAVFASFPTTDTTGTETNETAWRVQYDAQLWREGDQAITGLSVTGRAVVSGRSRTQHHVALSLMGNWERVQPGLVVGTSLNDLVQDRTFTPFAGFTLSLTYIRP